MPKPTQDVSLVAVTALNGESCAKGCTEGGSCSFAIISNLGNEGSPWMYINNEGGLVDACSGLGLTSWTTEDPTDIFGVLSAVFVINGAESLPIARSLDKGVSVTYLSGASDMADNNPYAGDMLNPTKIVVVGANGYIWISTDLGATWLTTSTGEATSEDLKAVKISPTNPSVIYAIGDNNAVVKSINGGYNWFALTGPSASDNLTAIEIVGENEVLIGNDDGELHQTVDGGTTWTQQDTLPSLPAAASISGISCCACGSVDKHGVCYAAVEDTGSTAHIILRNAGWASGQWELEEGFNGLDIAPVDIVCCNNNLAMVVAGNGTNGSAIGVISG
jgi:hypothetical protein